MKAQVTDFVDVQEKSEALSCNMPSGVTVLPQNFQSAKSKDELSYESLDLQLRDAFRESGILGTSLEKSEKDSVHIVIRESAIPEWIPPIIFVSVQLIQTNPAIVDLLLNIVSNFLYDKIKAVISREPSSSDIVEFDIVSLSIGDRLTYKRVRYKGSWNNKKLTDIKEFGNIIRKI